MKRIAIAAAALAAFTLTASAASMATSWFGCSNYKEYRAMIHLVAEKDRDAAMAYAISHDCKPFNAGDVVIISDTGVMTSCIRKRGNPTCYWVDNDAINHRD